MLDIDWLILLRNRCRKQRRSNRSRRPQDVPPSAVCTSAKAEVLEDRTLLAAFGFNFDVIASDLHPSLRIFGRTDPSDAPYTQLRYGQGTLSSLTDFPNLDAASV
ncbi:MAG: hypothetical protein GY903_25750 [Fuerstiella sp.]|nr:hypothetical protein [Fuerstiella sp.]MCP4857902.1 hypothetical protein [Fuerstiella sp.]